MIKSSDIELGKDIEVWFATKAGTQQIDPISLNTFIAYLEGFMDRIQEHGTGISVQGIKINNSRFSYDIDLIEQSCTALQDNLGSLHYAGNSEDCKSTKES